MVAPLTSLLNKDAFKWNNKTEECFKKMKLVMTSMYVLSAPNFSKTFILEYNASGIGVSTILMQDNHPIAF